MQTENDSDPVEEVSSLSMEVPCQHEIGSSAPLPFSQYSLGDDINKYIGQRNFYMPSLSKADMDSFDELAESRNATDAALLRCVEGLACELTARSAIVLQLGRLKKESIVASSLKHLEANLHSTAHSRPDSAASTPAAPKNRMDGVDVASLPAGFGKRKPAGVGGAGLKKPKTPQESAPEIQPNSTNPTPPPSS